MKFRIECEETTIMVRRRFIEAADAEEARTLAAGDLNWDDWQEVYSHAACEITTVEPYETCCECGTWSGVPCSWRGAEADTVLVEWMPEYLRESHEAAGNRGSWPLNGATRLRVSEDCALNMIEQDPGWCRIVSGGRAL